MRVLERRFPYRVGDHITFVVFSDVHLGNRLSSIHHFRENLIERYKGRTDVWFIALGDECDMIVSQTGDRRFQASMIDPAYLGIDCPIDRMIDDYCRLVEPIKDRIICMTDSNHHLEIEHRTGTSPTRRIAYNLWGKDAENRLLGYAGFLVARFSYEDDPVGRRNSRTRSLTWALSHRRGRWRQDRRRHQTSLGRVADDVDADIFASGHSHQLHAWDRVVLGVDHVAKNVVSRKRIRLNTGSYLKGYSDDSSTSYVEKKLLKPNCLGHVELHVEHTRDSMSTYYVKRMV